MDYPLVELGGAGHLLNILPANGFPVETYLPVLNPLMPTHRLVSLLPRAVWGDEPVPATYGTWETDLTQDFLSGLRQHDLSGIVGVGHSFGGVATMLAAIHEPWRFRALVLLDPTILSRQILIALRAMQDAGTIGAEFPLAARALKRQRQFATREDAFEYFRPRGIFQTWDEAALREYITHGLVPNANGFTLRWTPEWEAYYFSTGYTATWEMLPRLDGLLPILIVRGGESDTYTAESAEDVREILPSATHIDIPGHGHLFPHSAPAETARVIGDWLRQLP